MAHRILIYGVTGSGKRTLAAHVAQRTGLPYHAIDELMFESGWVTVADDEQRRRVGSICAGERWVIDHAYGKWIDIPLARVDLIVALDYPRWLSLSRLLRRSVRRLVTREPACNGNRETAAQPARSRLDPPLALPQLRADSRSYRRMESSGRPTIRLRSPREAEAWLATL